MLPSFKYWLFLFSHKSLYVDKSSWDNNNDNTFRLLGTVNVLNVIHKKQVKIVFDKGEKNDRWMDEKGVSAHMNNYKKILK